MSSDCPYCSAALDPAPKRKKECPACGKPIYVRKGKLVTEFDAYSQDWLLRLTRLNVTPGDFDRAKHELARQFGHAPGFYDVLWRILNNVVASGTGDPDYAYHEMAIVAYLEKKDPRPYLAQALTLSLHSMKMSGVKRVRISCYADQPDFSTCEACRSLHGTALAVDEALATLPVPNRCTSDGGLCRCEYQPA